MSARFAPLEFPCVMLREVSVHSHKSTRKHLTGRNSMSSLNLLKAASNLSDVANILGVSAKGLSYTLYKLPNANKYTSFTIPKKTGGVRTISAPCAHIKLIQKHLATHLYRCIDEISPRPEFTNNIYSHGFQKGLSIKTNANKHKNRRYVFNLDLEDFFPSINFGRVRGYFIKNNSFALNANVATVLAQIICHDNKLPQGAPTSPIVSEFVASIMDIRLGQLAAKNGCTYSRYADDITFSTNKRNFPKSIAVRSEGTEHNWDVGETLEKQIVRVGFKINEQKTRMQYCDSRQTATGLTVNQKVNVKKEYYKQVRYMCRELITKGSCYEVDQASKAKIPFDVDRLRGRLSFVYQIKGHEFGHARIKYKKGEPNKDPAFYRNYANFLNYDYFHANTMPLIICEGETDNIYLKCAVASLIAKVPSLATATKDPWKPDYLVNFFNYTKTTSAVLRLSGGTGEMQKLIYDYGKKFKHFHKGGRVQPVILLIDNDSGSKEIFAAIKNVTNSSTAIDGSAKYYQVTKNLFVVPIPKVGKKDTMIEDLFDPALLTKPLAGKTFHPEKKGFDESKHYGKVPFAKRIVKADAANVDFSGFLPVLEAIVDVMKIKLPPS